MMKRFFLPFLLLLTHAGSAQDFAPVDQYLIDSLVLDDISDADMKALDSVLNEYHSLQQDSSKYGVVSRMHEVISDDRLWFRYNRWLNATLGERVKSKKCNGDNVGLCHLYGMSLIVVGNEYQSQQNIGKMLEYYEQALAFSEEVDDKPGIAITLNQLGNHFGRRRDVVRSAPYHRRAMEVSEAINDVRQYGIAVNNMSYNYFRVGELDSAIFYAEKALEFQRNHDDAKGLAAALSIRGVIERELGNTEACVAYYHESVEAFVKAGDQKGEATLTRDIGTVYEEAGDFSKAIAHYRKALSIFETIPDSSGIAHTYHNLAGLYSDLEEYDQAVDYYKIALQIESGKNNISAMGAILNNIGATYKGKGDLDEALNYYEQSLQLKRDNNYKRGLAPNLVSIGTIHEEKGDVPLAIQFYKEAVEIARELKTKRHIANALGNLANAYYLDNQLGPARKAAEEALVMSQESGYAATIRNSARALYQVASSEKRWKEAFEMHQLYLEMRDSLDSKENKTAVIRSEYQYNYEKQLAIDSIQRIEEKKVTDAQLAESDAKLEAADAWSNFLMVLIIGIIVVGGVLFFYYRYKQKTALELTQKDTVIEKQRSIQFKLKALAAQMNPHFIFNSLNSVQYYIHKNDVANSKVFLSKFAGLMRQTLDNSEHSYIPLEEEIEALRKYIDLEQLRLDNKFNYNIDIDENIDLFDAMIPTLLIQPYVENAIWHGVSPLEKKGQIDIRILQEQERLKCVVEDNGVGRVKSNDLRNPKHKSYSMKITETRLDLINAALVNEMININIIDKKDEAGNPTGTKVELYVPINLAQAS